MICTHRDYKESWLGNLGVDIEDFQKKYIVSLYFVTTTLSTCGFGDISATKHDAAESFQILVLQFVGLLYYSYSIDHIQMMLQNEMFQSGEYANSMSEVVENLIVKAGKSLPKDNRIPGIKI